MLRYKPTCEPACLSLQDKHVGAHDMTIYYQLGW